MHNRRQRNPGPLHQRPRHRRVVVPGGDDMGDVGTAAGMHIKHQHIRLDHDQERGDPVLAGFRIPQQTLIALLLSASGLLLIGWHSLGQSQTEVETETAVWIGDLFFLAAALCWSIFGLLMRRWQIRPQLGIAGIASFSMLVSGRRLLSRDTPRKLTTRSSKKPRA